MNKDIYTYVTGLLAHSVYTCNCLHIMVESGNIGQTKKGVKVLTIPFLPVETTTVHRQEHVLVASSKPQPTD